MSWLQYVSRGKAQETIEACGSSEAAWKEGSKLNPRLLMECSETRLKNMEEELQARREFEAKNAAALDSAMRGTLFIKGDGS